MDNLGRSFLFPSNMCRNRENRDFLVKKSAGSNGGKKDPPTGKDAVFAVPLLNLPCHW